MSKINIILLILGIAFLIFSLFQLNVYNSGVVEIRSELEIEDGENIPYLYYEDMETKPVATAILLHGEIGGKTSLKHIGITLAHIGINSYILDMPGYSKSDGVYNKQTLNDLEAIHYFYNWLENNDKIIRDRYGNIKLITIGYSTGAERLIKAMMSEYQLKQYSASLGYNTEQTNLHKKYLIPKSNSTILISSFPTELIVETNPKNMFVVIDGTDKDLLRDKVDTFLKSIDEEPINSDIIFDDYIDYGSKFKAVVYPQTNSLTVIYNHNIINDISEWLIEFYKIDLKELSHYNQNNIRTIYLAVLFLSVILLLFPVSELISKLWLFDFKRPKEPYRTERYLSIFAKYIITTLLSTGFLMLFQLFNFLGISITNYIISFILYQFIFNIIFFRNYIFTAAKYDTGAGVKLLYGVLLSVAVYFIAGTVINTHFASVMMNLSRFLRFLPIFAVCFLYFILDEFIFRTELVYRRSGGIIFVKSFLLSYITKVISFLPVLILSILYFPVKDALAYSVIILLYLLLLYLQFLSLFLFRKSKSYYVSGFITAFIVAWFCTVIPPMVA